MTRLADADRLLYPDRVYRALIEAHRGLNDEDSARLNTRLVLIFAAALGDAEIIDDALLLALEETPELNR